MRILFVTHPLIGHFHSIAPLALAAQNQGHDVAVATSQRFAPVVQRAGLPTFAAGWDSEGALQMEHASPEWQQVQSLPIPPVGRQLLGFIDGLAPYMARDLIPLVDAWKTHLIVRDPVEFGSYIAAEHAAIPHASIMWALYIDLHFMVDKAMHHLRARFNLPEDPILASYDRFRVLKFLPPSLRIDMPPEPAVTRSFGAPPFDLSQHEDDLPSWVHDLPTRTTVCATPGTTFNTAPSVFRAVIQALTDEDVNVILTIGRRTDPA
jgi:UDP:flavonoid glycosyltransferase YjiC (YdhE family)